MFAPWLSGQGIPGPDRRQYCRGTERFLGRGVPRDKATVSLLDLAMFSCGSPLCFDHHFFVVSGGFGLRVSV